MVDKGTPYSAGDTATFRIYVYNQGTVTAAANTIKVKDYIPGDMILADAAWNAADSSYTFSNAIAAGSLDSVDIALQIAPSFMGTSITNNAEIVEDGGDDADSTPGSEANGNAPDGNDNDVAATDGSDDYDPATVPVQQGYDLALTKVLVDKGTPYSAGDTATFRIYVYNQGTVTAVANTVKVKDYIPSDMILADAAWNAADSSYTFSNAIAAGSLDSVDIALQVAPSFMGTSITNNAEIVEDGGDDADSTPGSEANGNAPDGNDNDTGLTDGSDDYDPATVPVQQGYDLALTKVLVDKGTPYNAGDTATFRIYVYNQGTVTAATNTIKVKDYIPSDMILADAAWNAADSSYTFSNAIAAGSLDSVDIALQIAPSFMGTSITNNAEIVEDGGDDADSTPGSEANGNAPDGNDNDVAATDGSDDYDPATVSVQQGYDLALTKVLVDKGTPYSVQGIRQPSEFMYITKEQ